MGRHSTAITAAVITPPVSPSRKRKRDQSPAAEIEVDIGAPEPPSKKALRKAKKATSIPVATTVKPTAPSIVAATVEPDLANDTERTIPASKRSEYGVWIGNLPWTATKNDVRNFLTKDTDISDDTISRLHLPAPSNSVAAALKQKTKLQNRGFAYIDLSTEEAMLEALSLSEKLLSGRRVLIKDSKSFEGRPEKPREDETDATSSGKPPSKRIFVGNLPFETTKEDLQEHFGRCGEVLDVHVATFEDSGKCKGYAWVEFSELEAGVSAVRGWVDWNEKADETMDEDEEEDIGGAVQDGKSKKKPRSRKWWVNKLQGRPLRMEFAEDKAVRYKKRYGKDGSAKKKEEESQTAQLVDTSGQPPSHTSQDSQATRQVGRKIDARTIKPGAALAAAPRSTGSIVQSQGKKTTFA